MFISAKSKEEPVAEMAVVRPTARVVVPVEEKMTTSVEAVAVMVLAKPDLNLINNESNIKKSVYQFDLDLPGMR